MEKAEVGDGFAITQVNYQRVCITTGLKRLFLKSPARYAEKIPICAYFGPKYSSSTNGEVAGGRSGLLILWFGGSLSRLEHFQQQAGKWDSLENPKLGRKWLIKGLRATALRQSAEKKTKTPSFFFGLFPF